MTRIVRMFRENRQDVIVGLLIAGIAFLVYANSLGNGFVWDDTNVIVTNNALRGSPVALLNSIDVTRDFEMLPYYRPLTILTFLLEERVHGLLPLPMHLVNVLLHMANAFLVFVLARTVIADSRAALCAGLLFAIHPINTETVDFISARNTLLAALFIMMAYLLHRRSVVKKSLLGALLAATVLMLGYFSKETALAALPFIVVLEIPSLRENAAGSRFQAAIRLLPYAAALTCYLVMRWLTLSPLGIQTSIIPGFGSQQLHALYKIPDLWTRLMDNLYIVPRYLLTLAWPTALSPRYEVPYDLQPFAIPLVAAWIFILAVIGWLITRGRSYATLFGLSWLAVFYLPVSGIVAFPSSPMADRYTYIPVIGLWIVISDQAGRLAANSDAIRRYIAVIAVLVLLVWGGLTLRRNMDWKSDITLFARFAEQYPDDAYSHAGLGNAYFGERDKDVRYLNLAKSEYEKALAIKPLLTGVHANMGYIKLAHGDSEGAIHYYTLALAMHPLDKESRLNRAIALEMLGRSEEALADFKYFLAIPGYELADARPYAEDRIRVLSK